MTNTHMDQMRQWWENAEQGVAHAGDTVIRHDDTDDSYEVYTVDVGLRCEWASVRILARAPKPKPAWHDAVAVIAHTDDGHIRQVWERDGDTDYWCGTEGYLVRTEKLRDVTPLIEAKVTDEMVARAMKFWDPNCPGEHDADDIQWAREFITAALGLDVD